ncbi:MAG: 50S ribosomal protein L29 [Candidatus Nomurabacteria bacterium]|nr:MAG: 50S ribosomal protein L29 [Candidatus Nomurabacteria bacterium]
MKQQELQNKTAAELQKILAEKRAELRELRFKVANGQLKDVRDVRTVRKTIARVLTMLHTMKSKATSNS